MKRYELQYTKDEIGMFRMSTVEKPALTDTHLVMFSEELELLQFQDNEKQIIYSVAMRPNIDIQRKNINGEPALVYYTEETCEALLLNFFKTGSNLGATVNHDGVVRNDMYIFSAWQVIDPTMDTAVAMNMKVEKGDIVLGQKVDNPEIWADIKSGKLTGFSFEAYLEPVLTQTNINMTKEEIDVRIKEILMQTEEEKAAKLKEEEEAAKLAMADAPIADEEPKEEPKPEEDLQAKIDELTTENNDLKAKLAEYETKEVAMSSELEAAKKVALEFSEQIEKGIKPNAVEKTYNEMTNYEKVKFNRGKL